MPGLDGDGDGDGDADGSAFLVAELGGETTAFTDTRNAFSLSARNLSNEQRRRFEVGDSFFTQNWVTAPASTDARDGLGPLFNAQSCSSCHVLDGRGRPPTDDDDPERGLLLRLSVPGTDDHGGPLPDPIYGGQLQDRAILGLMPEGAISIEWTEISGEYDDGTPYTLRAPTYRIADPAYGELSSELMISPRIAPATIVMGLLEAIPDSRLLELADPGDEDGDGISGRVNMVWDVRSGTLVIGRFGWKAGQPSVEQQSAGAFNGDIGITSTLFPNVDCTSSQTDCLEAINGGTPEVSDERLADVTLYASTLAVPAMRNLDDEEVRRGADVLMRAGCTGCHVAPHETSGHAIEALNGQTILPFTDLLLHDMGEGLSDHRPVFSASGSEWRTPPLWGIGLTETVNDHTNFLHDGRARSLMEAILWHDGEGAGSRDAFKALSAEDRAALIRFLESL
ncbi:MAG: c-type cytochrome [Chloroflexi bacterium]|nr:c-type cytochrome [Chloroflexota bacterium]MDA1146068.1 c-type cytochrome [Chloroflexota bacterium]